MIPTYQAIKIKHVPVAMTKVLLFLIPIKRYLCLKVRLRAYLVRVTHQALPMLHLRQVCIKRWMMVRCCGWVVYF